MAAEAVVEFRVVVRNSAGGTQRVTQYRTRTVETGIISLVPALVGVNAWSAWTDVPLIVEDV